MLYLSKNKQNQWIFPIRLRFGDWIVKIFKAMDMTTPFEQSYLISIKVVATIKNVIAGDGNTALSCKFSLKLTDKLPTEF